MPPGYEMKTYTCQVLDAQGNIKQIEEQSINEQLLIQTLEKKGLIPVRIGEGTGGEKKYKSKGKVRAQEILDFTDFITRLLSYGLNISTCLEILLDVYAKSRIKPVIEGLLEEVQKGTSYSESLKLFPQYFKPIYTGIVKIGETTGALVKVHKLLTEYLKRKLEIREKIFGTMFYPVMLLSVISVVFLLMIFIIIPNFKMIYDNLGIDPKGFIKFIFSLSDGLRKNWVLVLGVILLIPLSIFSVKYFPSLRKHIDRIVLKIPIMGSFLYFNEILNLSFSLELLFESGYSAKDTLAFAMNAVDNIHFKDYLKESEQEIIKGTKFSEVFKDEKLFNRRFIRLINL